MPLYLTKQQARQWLSNRQEGAKSPRREAIEAKVDKWAMPRYKPKKCFVCGRKVLISSSGNNPSFGCEAIKGTMPVEVRCSHFDCFIK